MVEAPVMVVRFPFVVAASVGVFAAGLAASRLIGVAHAQAAPFAATIYVPSDGIAFRTFDGRVVARLSYDAHGGMLDLYDEREQPATRVRADGGARGVALPSPAPAPAPPSGPTRVPRDDLGF
jgi:hypothetical protein